MKFGRAPTIQAIRREPEAVDGIGKDTQLKHGVFSLKRLDGAGSAAFLPWTYLRNGHLPKDREFVMDACLTSRVKGCCFNHVEKWQAMCNPGISPFSDYGKYAKQPRSRTVFELQELPSMWEGIPPGGHGTGLFPVPEIRRTGPPSPEPPSDFAGEAGRATGMPGETQ